MAPLNLLVIQPSAFCNIDCSYCYLDNRLDRRRMNITTVRAVARFLKDVTLAYIPLSVVWHAGEPLAVPKSFYEEAFACFASASPPISVQHHFQTNATLLNDDWCEFVKRSGVLVGVSIDGPKEIHNAHRVDRSGRGTFDQVMHGISKLREHGIPFTVISVITDVALREPDTVWKFFGSLGASQVGFNVEEAEGTHRLTSLVGHDLRKRVTSFFSRIAELQRRTPEVSVRELEEMRRHLMAPSGSTVQRSDNRPGAILNIDVEGNVMTFSPELLGQAHPDYGSFNWGNVHTESWNDLIQNPQFLRVQRAVEDGIEKCRVSCGYFAVCGGGNPTNKLSELGTFAGTETQHCRLIVQAVADVLLDQMERAQRTDGSRNHKKMKLVDPALLSE
jgi:uncharacterized protein